MLAQEFYDEIWWPRCEERLREVTQESYKGCWKNYIQPAFGQMELNDITPRVLDKWLVEKKITANTWKVCKAFLRTAYKYEEMDKEPCSRVLHPPKKHRPEPPTLSYWEMQELMDGLIGTPIYTTICTSCYCGLRREEACALNWEDFEWNIDNGEISFVNITKGVQYLHGKEIFVEPKTKLSRRRLPIPHELVRRIYPYREEEGRLLGDLHVHQAASRLRQYTKVMNLPYVPMSNLRTSWATYMINSGAPVSLISRYMGHADVETTVRWYTKPNEKELEPLTAMWSHPASYKYDAKRPELMRKPDDLFKIHEPSSDNLIYVPETFEPTTEIVSPKDTNKKTLKKLVSSIVNKVIDDLVL